MLGKLVFNPVLSLLANLDGKMPPCWKRCFSEMEMQGGWGLGCLSLEMGFLSSLCVELVGQPLKIELPSLFLSLPLHPSCAVALHLLSCLWSPLSLRSAEQCLSARRSCRRGTVLLWAGLAALGGLCPWDSQGWDANPFQASFQPCKDSRDKA